MFQGHSVSGAQCSGGRGCSSQEVYTLLGMERWAVARCVATRRAHLVVHILNPCTGVRRVTVCHCKHAHVPAANGSQSGHAQASGDPTCAGARVHRRLESDHVIPHTCLHVLASGKLGRLLCGHVGGCAGHISCPRGHGRASDEEIWSLGLRSLWHAALTRGRTRGAGGWFNHSLHPGCSVLGQHLLSKI